MRKKLDKLLDEACITRTQAIKDIGISRNAFYTDKINCEATEAFINAHQSDWKYTPEKFFRAIEKSGKTQLAISEKLEIHNVTVCEFLKGRQRPTRATGNYQAIRDFCRKWFEN